VVLCKGEKEGEGLLGMQRNAVLLSDYYNDPGMSFISSYPRLTTSGQAGAGAEGKTEGFFQMIKRPKQKRTAL
jgi:hypothetical protein